MTARVRGGWPCVMGAAAQDTEIDSGLGLAMERVDLGRLKKDALGKYEIIDTMDSSLKLASLRVRFHH
jgi:hypothetical protein